MAVAAVAMVVIVAPGGFMADSRWTGTAGIAAAMCLRTWRKTFRRPVVLVFSLVQPLMWMLFFGFLFHRFDLGAGPGHLAYLDFLLPGVCVMTVLFGASQAGTGLLTDMQGNLLARMLQTPAPATALLGGKLLADVLRLLGQAGVVAVLGMALGSRLVFRPEALTMALLQLAVFAWAYASLSCWIALATRSQETMGVFIQAVNMPLLFTSTVLVPHRQMPEWLAMAARWNPLSAVADGLRSALLRGESGKPALVLLTALACGAFACAVAALGRNRRR